MDGKRIFVRDEAPKFEYSRTLTYVQIPLLTHIYFGSRKVKGFFNLGPEVGFLINDKITANFDYNKYDAIEGFPQGYRTNEQLRMEVQNTFDYGIAGGAGIEFLSTVAIPYNSKADIISGSATFSRLPREIISHRRAAPP